MHKSNSIKEIVFYNENDPNKFAKYIIKVLGEEIGKKVHEPTLNTRGENARIEENEKKEDSKKEERKLL